MVIRNISGEAVFGPFPHQRTSCFPSPNPVNEKHSFNTSAGTSGAERLI
jgi:hypothetical protein